MGSLGLLLTRITLLRFNLQNAEKGFGQSIKFHLKVF